MAQQRLFVAVKAYGPIQQGSLLARRLLEIRSVRPRRWTIVRQQTLFPRPPEWISGTYVVCPNCGGRMPLPPRMATRLSCVRCQGLFRIAWNETYLRASGESSS